MATPIIRAWLLGALALSVSGCAGTSSSSPRVSAATAPPTPANAPDARFGGLRPGPAPADWHTARVASGATIAYPPTWLRIHGDLGTASAGSFDSSRRFLGYLNLTPRQGGETLTNWPTFRLRHNAAEGDREVSGRGLAAGLRFRTGRGTCVRDSYSTSTGAHYVEIACLIVGHHVSSVVVGAAPASVWSAQEAVIERAISATIS